MGSTLKQCKTFNDALRTSFTIIYVVPLICSEKRITELLDEIEKKKSAICIDTVRTVQESFRKIFQELVLKASGIRGYGRFVMHGDSIEFTETNRLEVSFS